MNQLYFYLRRLLNMLVATALPPAACRFQPTCSVYCQQALRVHGPFKGSLKCLWRLLRCHPFNRGGFDPV